MKDYMLIFRNEKKPDDTAPDPEQMKIMVKQWQQWIGSIFEKGNFSGTNRLHPEGKVLRSQKTITDGPYVEGKEMVGGYLIVKAKTIDDAVRMAQGCPGLNNGSTVEVRSVMSIESDASKENFLEEKSLA